MCVYSGDENAPDEVSSGSFYTNPEEDEDDTSEDEEEDEGDADLDDDEDLED